MKIYLSGKISGMDQEKIRRKFMSAEISFRRDGHLVINPVEEILKLNSINPEGLNSWQQELEYLGPLLDMADSIYMISGWQKSKMSNMELKRAIDTGKDVIYQQRDLTIDAVVRATLKAGIKWQSITAKSRKQPDIFYRHAFCYLAHEAGCTLSAIGRMINRDHTTIINSIKSTEKGLSTNYQPIVFAVNKIKQAI